MSQDLQISQKVIDTYDQALRPIAEKLSFELPVQAREPAGFPSVLCLGNHSSGKSSFINHLLGEDIQKTGLAPTDDGFTIITHGSQRESLDGHTVTSHPALPWKNLERLGPAFLNRLKLKTIPNQLLTSFALIDSPGMIDAIGAANTREYDFAAGVRFFAEKADLILFFFDPDKPGTTAETIGILTQTLAGLEYKLLIILNKVDLFQNIRDFARTYGTLSWNLSKAIRTKDIPHIYNIYLPEQRTQETLHASLGIPLNDFDQSREEVIQEIHRTPTRRADNLVSDLLQATKKLILHAKLCSTVKLEYRKLQFKWGVISLSILLAGVLATWGATQTWPGWEVTAGIGTAGLLATIATWAYGKWLRKQFTSKLEEWAFLDTLYADTFRHELALQDRGDLQAMWAGMRSTTRKTFTILPPQSIPNLFSLRRSIRRMESLLEREIPKLRRQISPHPPMDDPA
ncbi:MAG: dynamin family protein [Verrucomicrobiota bacterium]|nr:dynamin family protein [Verrucomicrobiota bacterium]